MRRIKTLMGIVLLLLLVFSIQEGAFAQENIKAEYEAKIAALEKKRVAIAGEMTDASNQRNRQEYDRLEIEYNKIIDEIKELQEEFRSKGNTEATGKTAYNNGLRSYQYRRWDEALGYFDKAIEALPDMAKAHNMRGLTLRNLQRYNEAEAALKKAITLDPEDAKPYSNLGQLYAAMDNADMALEYFNLALQKDSTLYRVHYHKGTIYEKQGKLDLAVQSFKSSTDVNPEYSQGFRSWGVMLYKQGRFEPSVEMLRKAVAIDPEDGRGWYRLSESLIKLNRYSETIEAGEKALQYGNRSVQAPVHISMGQAYAGLGDKGKAIEHYTQAKSNSRYADYANWAIEKLKKELP